MTPPAAMCFKKVLYQDEVSGVAGCLECVTFLTDSTAITRTTTFRQGEGLGMRCAFEMCRWCGKRQLGRRLPRHHEKLMERTFRNFNRTLTKFIEIRMVEQIPISAPESSEKQPAHEPAEHGHQQQPSLRLQAQGLPMGIGTADGAPNACYTGIEGQSASSSLYVPCSFVRGPPGAPERKYDSWTNDFQPEEVTRPAAPVPPTDLRNFMTPPGTNSAIFAPSIPAPNVINGLPAPVESDPGYILPHRLEEKEETGYQYDTVQALPAFESINNWYPPATAAPSQSRDTTITSSHSSDHWHAGVPLIEPGPSFSDAQAKSAQQEAQTAQCSTPPPFEYVDFVPPAISQSDQVEFDVFSWFTL